MGSSLTADVEFFFDPVCPFCWVTSTWLHQEQRQHGIAVEWRFILAVQARGVDTAAILQTAGLEADLAEAQHDDRWDTVLATDTDEALARVGDDVGTPILSFSPPDGPASFGPVISDVPSDEDALAYWHALTTLADMPGFAEVKRTLRTVPATALTAPLRGQTTTVS